MSHLGWTTASEAKLIYLHESNETAVKGDKGKKKEDPRTQVRYRERQREVLSWWASNEKEVLTFMTNLSSTISSN